MGVRAATTAHDQPPWPKVGSIGIKDPLMKLPLLGLDLLQIRQALGEAFPAYRARQIYEAIYCQRVSSIEEITTLPKWLRQELDTRFTIGWPRLRRVFESADGTRRFLLELDDGQLVETVLMPEPDRDTVCVSTQVGCSVGCKFCLTASLGLRRNLSAGEIAGQVLWVARQVGLDPHRRQLNVVLMGQGEPLLNLEAVAKAIRLLVDPQGFGLSVRRITLSTVGIVPKIYELAKLEPRPKLAISLNATTQEQRAQLIPIARKYTLAELMAACRAYPLRSWERLTFEYVLLRGVNDQEADARRLVSLVGQIRCKVNLIPFNPAPGLPFQRPEENEILRFQQIVQRSVPCFVRWSRGVDVFGACGQLRCMELAEEEAGSGPRSESGNLVATGPGFGILRVGPGGPAKLSPELDNT